MEHGVMQHGVVVRLGSNFGELSSTDSGPELVEGSRAADLLSICSMGGARIILILAIFRGSCQAGWGQSAVPVTVPTSPYSNIVVGQPTFVPGNQTYVPAGPSMVPTAPVGQPIGQFGAVYPQPSVLPGAVAVPPPAGVVPG